MPIVTMPLSSRDTFWLPPTTIIFLNESRTRQATRFADGTRVEVDFENNTYSIRYPGEQ